MPPDDGAWSLAGLGSNSALPLPGHLTQGSSPHLPELSLLIREMGGCFWKAGPDGLNGVNQTQGLAWGKRAEALTTCPLPGERCLPVGLHQACALSPLCSPL